MTRRVHVKQLRAGEIALDASQARHARDVLRLENGTTVEAFDDAGAVAPATLVLRTGGEVAVRVDEVRDPSSACPFEWVVASAVPKGDRADWMVEKLSELGTAAFIPLATERSVVLPEGRNKRDRWARIATESAKQSRRAGVMRIGELTSLDRAIDEACRAGNGRTAECWYLSTAKGAAPVADAADGLACKTNHSPSAPRLTLFIGPEGGWSPSEIARFGAAKLTAVSLTATILRVETAAVTAAAVVATVVAPRFRRPDRNEHHP